MVEYSQSAPFMGEKKTWKFPIGQVFAGQNQGPQKVYIVEDGAMLQKWANHFC